MPLVAEKHMIALITKRVFNIFFSGSIECLLHHRRRQQEAGQGPEHRASTGKSQIDHRDNEALRE
jgi:hypothetical protein